jgi:hypothetical protein
MYQCPLCKQNFSRQQRLESHLNRKTPCTEPENVPKITISDKNIKLRQNIILCQYCKKTFARKDNLVRHQKDFCYQKPESSFDKTTTETVYDDYKTSTNRELEKQIAELKENSEKQMAELKEKLEKQMAELKEKPMISNQILQVVCITSNDNYLDMLTEEWGFDRAIEYIKDCALANLTGDCKLIKGKPLSNPSDVFELL